MKSNLKKYSKILCVFFSILIFLFPIDYIQAVDKEETTELKVNETVNIIVDGDISQFDSIKDLDPNAEIVRQFSIIDAFSCRVSKETLEDLRECEIKYYIEENYEKVEDKSTNLENMPINVSASLAFDEEYDNISTFDGRGKIVSVLDSGVDVSHKDLQNTPIGVKLTSDNVGSIISKNNLNGKFYSPKIPYAYNYADNNDDIIDSNKTAIDFGHGMHVIGIIAGDSDDPNSGVTGISKNAQILSMKVFSNNPKDNGSSTEGAIISAIEDSIILDADVINMSLTIPSGIEDLNRPIQRAVKAATEKGIIVIAAAGNTAYSTYPKVMTEDAGTVGSPAIVEDVIAVGSYENEFINGSAFTHNGKDIIYSKIYGDISKIKDQKIVDGGNGSPEEIPENDGVVLIHRSGLQFIDMVKSAYEKGAKAVIFYNRENDDEYVTNVGELSTDIPVIFVSYKDGIFLKENLDEIPDFSEKLVKVKNKDLGMSTFSSHGPSSDLSIKPEITAIGGKVYSLANDNNYAVMSGTSMAAPYISGITLNYLNFLDSKGIEKDPNYIKNAMMNTAEVKMSANGYPYSITQQGSGMVDFQAMINQELMVTYKNKAKVELGQIDGNIDFTLDIENLTSDDINAKVSFSDVLTIDNEKAETKVLDGALISATNSEILISSDNESLNFNLDLSNAREGYVEGYIFIETENTKVTIPYLGYHGDFKNLPIFDMNKNDPKSIFNEQGLYYMVFDKSGRRYRLENQGGEDMNPEFFSINPENNDAITNVIPKISLLRNVKDFNVYVTDNNGNIIRYIDHQDTQRKASLYEDRKFLSDELWSWKGNYYDKDRGEKVIADEGIYNYVIEATPILEGAEKQSIKFPIKIDKTPPFVKSKTMIIDSNTVELSIEAEEKGDYKTDIKHFLFLIDGKGYEEDGKKLFKLEKINGVYKKTLKLDDSLPNTFEIHIGASDYAGNMGVGTYKIMKENSNLIVKTDKLKYGIKEDIKLKFNYPEAVGYKVFYNDKLLDDTKENYTNINFSELGDKTIVVEAYDKDNNTVALNTIILNISKDLTNPEIDINASNNIDSNKFIAKIDILNKYKDSKSITYITCVYDKNMKMLNSLSSTIELEGYEKSSVTNEVFLPEGSFIIKNFVWDNFKNLNTLFEEEIINIDEDIFIEDLAA